jgi:hypothetical protein
MASNFDGNDIKAWGAHFRLVLPYYLCIFGMKGLLMMNQ